MTFSSIIIFLYEIANESIAKNAVEENFISSLSFLAASLDRLIDDDSIIIMIKCPYNERLIFKDDVKDEKLMYVVNFEKRFILKNTSYSYYYQITRQT